MSSVLRSPHELRVLHHVPRVQVTALAHEGRWSQSVNFKALPVNGLLLFTQPMECPSPSEEYYGDPLVGPETG